jgi:hypothetical protein
MKYTRKPHSESDLLKLVAGIYDAAADPRLWNQFLEQFSNAMDGRTTTMVVIDDAHANRNVAAAVRADPASQRIYEEYYGRIDAWFNNGKHLLTTGNVVTGQMLCPESWSVLNSITISCNRSTIFTKYVVSFQMTSASCR